MKRSLFVARLVLLCGAVSGLVSPTFATTDSLSKASGITKVQDLVIYTSPQFYCAFPSVIRKNDGTFLVAFRRAPDRRIFGEKGNNHVDPNSYLVGVSSKDGLHWSSEPELIYAYPFGGSQDPCLLKLKDGTIICTSYTWGFIKPEAREQMKKPISENSGATFMGGYVIRSTDGAKTWKGPYYPPHISPELNFTPMGEPMPAYNRGALYEGKSGRVYWVVAANDSKSPAKTSNHLLVSDDKGVTWKYTAVVAEDPKVTFNETSIYETPKGDLVAFMRTANYEDQACIARSTDGGKTFKPWQSMGFKGHPLQAHRLPDNCVLLVYGYRHKPYGIKARILNAECTDFATAPEFTLRDDGGSTDLGYPWTVQLDKNRVLVVYYFNHDMGTRYIAGTVLEIK